MYGRNRSPGNGYRGGGGGGSGLTPPRNFNSDFRNFNRSFGRGAGHPSPRSSQVSPPLPPSPIHNHHRRHPSPPTRKPDLFIEAGRLAAKYLVSKGLLPSEALSPEGSYNSLKNNNVDHSHESDGNSSRRTSPSDNYGSLGTSAKVKRSGRISPHGTYDGSDNVSRENGAVWLSESHRAVEANDNVSSVEADSKEVDSEVCRSSKDTSTTGLAPTSEAPRNQEQEVKITENGNSSFGSGNNGPSTGAYCNEDSSKGLESESNTEHRKTIIGANDRAFHKDTTPIQEGMTIQHRDDGSNMSTKKNTTELCRSESGVAESHLSLTDMGAKTDASSVAGGSNSGDAEHAAHSAVSIHDHGSSGSTMLSNRTIPSGCPDFHNSRADPTVCMGIVEGQAVDQEKCAKPQTCVEKVFMFDGQLSGALPEFQRFSSVVKGEKRALEDEYMGERAKKAKHWLSVGPMNEHSHFSEPREKCSSSPNLGPSADENAVDAPHHGSSFGAFLFPRSDSLPSLEYNEEKKLFPDSFRICDLNLMEASDHNANHRDLMTVRPSTSATNTEASVDVDLSMSNNFSLGNGYNSATMGKEVEVIDLEGNSLPGDRGFNAKTQAELLDMEHLPSHGQNPDDNPDAQDGYGSMISELIGNDITNCPSVQLEIQPLGNEAGLPPGEGILNDDDPIYMSLGEIPLSILRMWE